MNHSEQAITEIVSFEIREQIGILKISNGNQNKIHQADFLELDCLKGWLSQEDLKGLIILGQGRHFSAGADVDNIKINKDKPDYLRESLKKGREILSYIQALPLVTVGAISGICFGAGLEIALSCQLRVCTANAILAFPESNLGIMPGLAGTVRLPQLIGKRKALEIIISGKSINAEEAYEIGLVDKLVPNKEHLSGALQLINELTENKTPQQIRSIVQAVNNSFNKTQAEAMECEGEMFLELVKNL